MTDREIVALYLRRDPAAAAEIEKAYGRQCLSLARKILPSSEDAEECVNDCFLRLWQRIPPDQPDSLQSYLFRILRNLCYDRLRRQGAEKRGGSAVTVSLEELRHVTGRSSVESQFSARELGAAVDRFLRTQPERSRAVFLRRYYYFDERREIAERFGITSAQVSVLLSRTRSRLRDYLKKEGFL